MGNPSPSEHDHEHSEESCPKCWAQLSTPLFCETCHEPLEVDDPSSPFQTLGVPESFELNKMALRKRLLALSRHLHPDFYGNADDQTRDRAQRNTAELNAAFEILSDDFHRADWLVKSLGGPTESDERQMPAEFLAEVMEWNEAIEDARDAETGSPEAAALEELRATLASEREAIMNDVSERLSPLPDARAAELAVIRRRLNAVRYLDRALGQIAELSLAKAGS